MRQSRPSWKESSSVKPLTETKVSMTDSHGGSAGEKKILMRRFEEKLLPCRSQLSPHSSATMTSPFKKHCFQIVRASQDALNAELHSVRNIV